MDRSIYLLVVIIILILFISAKGFKIWRNHTRAITIEGQVVNVVAAFENSQLAAKTLAELNKRTMDFLVYLRGKYQISGDEKIGGSESQRELIVAEVLRRYNPDAIYEGRPNNGSETSFTLDKGKKIVLCLRSAQKPADFEDMNTLVFVVLHEISHMGDPRMWGHPTRFWQIFKFMLQEAVALGIYVPEDYSVHPRLYCGMNLKNNPLFFGGIIPI
ncbi:MAG: hypothetical protein M0R33_13740 [Methylomonas sp.]|jgi:hypothetical protein|uniref:Wss1p-related putative metallopeptidase n=1 Tax=Methylomonas sp. TaxID=418 RepID=UPI0025DE73A1|nr:Wss1p-related putative metallopeptidase [Methylomonas sp.]MCK9607497.1 hypothetical protein [Methylomonas sp.]